MLLDRGFSSNTFLEAAAGTGAAFLARLSALRKPPVLRRFDDGSFLSRIGQLEVRVIECEIATATATGRSSGVYRLATTLLDHRRHPAFELVRPREPFLPIGGDRRVVTRTLEEAARLERGEGAGRPHRAGRPRRSATAVGLRMEVSRLLAVLRWPRLGRGGASTQLRRRECSTGASRSRPVCWSRRSALRVGSR
ncbi:hypothetical protein [Kitasatospora sp. NPDC087314]|uniref:hypothetical protein n=1 Tax=Kitasatospora sp. NPDC087314 TaxID=3364068 RepID=UPI003815410F